MPNVARPAGTEVRRVGNNAGKLQQVGGTVRVGGVLCGLTAITVSSCSTRRSGGVPAGSVVPSSVQSATVRDSSITTHPLSPFQPGRLVYDLVTTSVIESNVGDSIPRVDSMRLNSVISAEFVAEARESQVQAVIQIDSTYLTTTSTPRLQFGTVQRRYAIHRSGQVQSITTAARVCTIGADNPVTGVEILPRFPAVDPLPELWSDTTTYDLCRGGVLLQATRVATYRRAIPLSNTSDSWFIRQAHLTLKGRGTQWDQPVEATGSGDSIDTLTLSRIPVRLTRVAGSGELEVRFASKFRNQVLRQSSQLQIHLRP